MLRSTMSQVIPDYLSVPFNPDCSVSCCVTLAEGFHCFESQVPYYKVEIIPHLYLLLFCDK